MLATECPPRENLKNYLDGKLNEEDSAVFERHLLQCENCDRVAGELEQEPDSFVEAIQADTEKDSPSQDGEQGLTGAIELIHYNPLTQSFQCRPTGNVGSYELLERLGRGGMGSVFLARHRELDKRVAIKLLPALSAQREEVVARFRREIKAAGRLEHPAIVRATDAGQADGTHYLVMEAIDGLDVSRTARLIGRLGIADACKIAREAALGLSYAHGEGIVHRDVKPSNLMLDTAGQVKILDFGLALTNLWVEGAAELTTVGQLMGTLDYMAPEQAERSGSVDYRADLYSLGATLFRLLAGRPPLAASPNLSPLEKLRLLADHSPPRIDTLRDDVPCELVQLLGELLARDPYRRPASAAHVAERLEPFTESANLALLLSTARAAAEREPEAAIAGTASDSQQHRPVLQARKVSKLSRGLRFATWVAAALVPLLLVGGILFVIEMTKGQLVIQSEAENVKIKLVQGEEPVQDLQIHQGTQVTRLRSGKYEILIDSPSDMYTISNNQFTIHSGDTIVATITSRSTSSTSETALGAASSKELTEPVYMGKTLDEWLTVLKYEKGDAELQNAIGAVSALASPVRGKSIVPIIAELMVHPPRLLNIEGYALEILGVLAAASGKDFIRNLCNVLNQCDVATQMKWIRCDYSRIPVQTADELRPLLTWTDKVMNDQETTPEFCWLIGQMLRQFLHARGWNVVSTDSKIVILQHLRSYKQLDKVNYWLYFPEPDDATPNRSLDFPWSDELRDETLKRAYEALIDPKANSVEVCCAAMIATSTIPHGGKFSSDQTRELVESLRKRLSKLLEYRETFSLVGVPSTLEQFAGPSFDSFLWRSSIQPEASGSISVSEEIAILNFIQAFQFAKDLIPELAAVLAAYVPTEELRAVSDLVLLGRIPAGRSNRSAMNWSQIVKNQTNSNKLQGTIQYFFYLQIGQLLGKDLVQLANEVLNPVAEVRPIVIQPGDTLAIYVDRILPMVIADDPLPAVPVFQAGKKPPVLGVPVPVTEKGEIVLPIIGLLKVENLTLEQTYQLIKKAYIDGKILKEDERSKIVISVNPLLKAGEQLEVRNVSAKQPNGPKVEAGKK